MTDTDINSKIAKKIVKDLTNKVAEHVKEIPAGTSVDLFHNPIDSEPESSQISDKDLFGSVKARDSEDRDNAVLPPEVENSDKSDDTSDTEDITQGYESSGEKPDDAYTGSGDGPAI